MPPRQTNPDRWLIIDRDLGSELSTLLRRLPRGSGVLLVHKLAANEQRRLRILAGLRGHVITDERRGKAARVHSARELTRALAARPRLVLLSPIYETNTHPGWKPLPRMRAAALARLCRRNALALGGMNAKRFSRSAPLGFRGWAGISAFRT